MRLTQNVYYTKIRAQKHLFFSFLGYFKKAWLFQYLPFLVNKWHTHTYKLLTPTLTFACIQRSLFFRFPLFSFFVFFFFLPSSLCSLDTSCKTRFYYTRYITGKISTLLLAIEKKCQTDGERRFPKKKSNFNFQVKN